MTALPAVQSPLRYISTHAVDKYCILIESRRHVARLALFKMYRASRVATEKQLRMLHTRIDFDATYYISETTAGCYLMLIKRGCLVTIWEIRPL